MIIPHRAPRGSPIELSAISIRMRAELCDAFTGAWAIAQKSWRGCVRPVGLVELMPCMSFSSMSGVQLGGVVVVVFVLLVA